MTILIGAKNLSIEFPVKKIFENVSLAVSTGDRIGVVGRNGEGKSTLLSVLAGLLQPDSGEVIVHGSLTIGLLQQSDALDDEASVGGILFGNAPKYTWAADRKTREIITSLIGNIDREMRVGQLSGGQRRRVDLARLLISDWDVLMLDEPTNHLDLPGITWLAEHLKTRWPKDEGALLVVTHDRWFFDEVSTLTWDVHDRTVETYEGGFSAYIQQQVDRERQTRLASNKRQNALRKELAWLARGAKARTSKPKFRLDAARALIADDPPLRNSVELKQTAMTRLGRQVLELSKVSVSYDGAVVLNGLDWIIGPGERVGLVGENATGKTTLINVIRGVVTPDSGEVRVGKTVRIALLSQQLDELSEHVDKRVIEVLDRYRRHLVVDGKSVTTVKLLERLGFTSSLLQTGVSDLSGGQKRRLQLLLTLVDEPNFLILDEPGNDMDTEMLAAMEDMLDSWAGTLLLVSHDRYLMERVTDSQYALIDGQIRHLPAGVDEFVDLLKNRETKPEVPAKISSEILVEQSIGAWLRQQRKLLATTERKIVTLEKKRAEITAEMLAADPADYLTLAGLEQELRSVGVQISQMEDTRMELSELLENRA